MVVVLGAEFLNETGEVSGCLDQQLQRTVPIGDWYHSHNCEICLCSSAQRMCKQVYCAPPESCDGYMQKDPSPNVCCDVCVPIVVERENNREGLNLRLGVGTVLLFFLLFLILFAFHRLRKKRSFHRCHLRSRSRSSEDEVRGQTSVVETTITETDAVVCLDGYAFPEAPPPYQTTIPSPTLSLRLGETQRSAPAPISPPIGEPPPPYASTASAAAAAAPPLSVPLPLLALPSPATSDRTSPSGRPPVLVRVFPVSPRIRPNQEEEDESLSDSSCSSAASSSSSSSQSSGSSDRLSGACSCSECEEELRRSRGSLASAVSVAYSEGAEDVAGPSSGTSSAARVAAKGKRRLKNLLKFKSAKCKRQPGQARASPSQTTNSPSDS